MGKILRRMFRGCAGAGGAWGGLGLHSGRGPGPGQTSPGRKTLYCCSAVCSGVQVGWVAPESPAERAGLRARDWVWQAAGQEVCGRGHGDCVRLVREAGLRLVLVVERAGEDGRAGVERQAVQQEHGRQYYVQALTGHGLSGKATVNNIIITHAQSARHKLVFFPSEIRNDLEFPDSVS